MTRAHNDKMIIGTFVRELPNCIWGTGEERTIIGLLDGVEGQDEYVRIKGRAREDQFESGLTYRLSGYWQTHEKYGTQFCFTGRPAVATPNGERGTVGYLAKAAGIGPRRAQAIWNRYGPDSLRVIREEPDRVAAEISGVTAHQAQAAAEFFSRNIVMEQSTIEVDEMLSGRGFPRQATEWTLNRFGTGAAAELRRNPYCLLALRGVGFPTADRLYRDLGLPLDAPVRQARCVWYALHSDTQGHTWFDADECRQSLRDNISPSIDLRSAVASAVAANLVVTCERDGKLWVAERAKAANEDEIVNRIAALRRQDPADAPPDWPDPDKLNLSEHQRQQYVAATASGNSRIAILAGRPGSGKSHSTAEIIRHYAEQHGYGGILVCAPTGLAAKQVTKYMSRCGIPLRGRTIHSSLGVADVSEDGEFRFTHGPDCPLPYDFIVVDELSMVPSRLLASLLGAARPNAMLLMVGDPNQLAPIGAGAPLRDMLAAGLPQGILTEIHRNSGLIVKACSDILDRGTFDCPDKFDFANGVNMVCLGGPRPERQIETLRAVLGRIENPVWDSQVLTAVNDHSPLARRPMNQLLRDLLNPDGRTVAGSPFRERDKVICTKNGRVSAYCVNEWGIDPEQFDQFVADEVDDDGKVAAANGEIGRVLRVEPSLTYIQLGDPLRIVKIPRGKGRDEDDTACDFDLAYCLTYHRGQGSQFRYSILLIDESSRAKFVCTRELIYTGISRGQEATILIGSLATAKSFCRTSGIWRRKTFLAEKLRGEMPLTDYGMPVPAAVQDGAAMTELDFGV